MALYDKASLVLIPSQYKEGKLYNIKPLKDSFEFERGSAATRVNKDGLIEQVGVSSTQLWNDGDVGTVGTGSYDDGIITMTASTGNDYVVFRSLENFKASDYYEISFDTVVNSGSFCLLQGNGVAFSPNYLISESGSYSRIVQYTHATSGNLFFWSGNVTSLGVQFDGTISNISIKKVNIDTPRLDYSGTEPSLLLEPQRTNLVTHSEKVDEYSNSNTICTSNYSLSPEGVNNSTKVRFISSSTNSLGQDISVSSGDSVTQSIFVKYIDTQFVQLWFGSSGFAGGHANFDLINNQTSSYSGASSSIESFGNGWYRISTTKQASSSNSNTKGFALVAVDSLTSLRFNDEVDGSVEVFGAQAEQGSYATSYIPTNGQTETRLYDYMNSDLSNVLGTGDATFIFDFDFDTIRESGSYLYRIYSGTDSFGLKVSSITNRNLQLRAISGFTTHITINEAAFETSHKMAVRITGSVVEVFYNGAKITGTMTGLSSYNWSLYEITGNNTFVGKTKQLLVFPEALTDTELQQLTTI